MRLFKFFWLDGKSEVGRGASVADAFSRLGYSAGAMSVLDYYSEIFSEAF